MMFDARHILTCGCCNDGRDVIYCDECNAVSCVFCHEMDSTPVCECDKEEEE